MLATARAQHRGPAEVLWLPIDVGVLPPAWIGANGRRYYLERQLLRLQQILYR